MYININRLENSTEQQILSAKLTQLCIPHFGLFPTLYLSLHSAKGSISSVEGEDCSWQGMRLPLGTGTHTHVQPCPCSATAKGMVLWDCRSFVLALCKPTWDWLSFCDVISLILYTHSGQQFSNICSFVASAI